MAGPPPNPNLAIPGGRFDFGILPIPKYLQYSPERPFKFTLFLNAIFGFASTFTVANLYYCQPILVQLAEAFHTDNNGVSRIPTLTQAGYAVGLVLISPIGDLVRRRPLLLGLVFTTASLTIGLAITNSLVGFEVISFFVGVFTVAPQVLIPLTADLAPLEKRASAVSIVVSGLLLGILVARVLAGIIAEFVSYTIIYYMALGLQYFIFIVLYFTLPDYPAKNSNVGYFGIIASMCKLAVTEPLLIQACLISFASSAVFTAFWVTLTFLLQGEGSPFHLNTLDVGLFGLIGIFGVMIAPLTGKLIDKMVTWHAALIATITMTIFQAIMVGAGGISLGAPIVACVGLDWGRQMQQVALTTSVYSISMPMRARLNAVLILSIFLGQVMGTSVGTQTYDQYGWRICYAIGLAWMGFQLFVHFLRGPHVSKSTWFGFSGGFEPRKSVAMARAKEQQEAAAKAAAAQKETEPETALPSGAVTPEKRETA